MNQKELNMIAWNFINSRSLEVGEELHKDLKCDLEKYSEQISGEALHLIHNLALLKCLVWLNSPVSLGLEISEETLNEYYEFADSLKPKFMAIIKALKDFQATE